jgi:hypothetical protein
MKKLRLVDINTNGYCKECKHAILMELVDKYDENYNFKSYPSNITVQFCGSCEEYEAIPGEEIDPMEGLEAIEKTDCIC